MPTTKTERRILITILCTFAILGTLYSITIPIFEASDELWHYPMVQHIATHWTLPVQPLEPGTSSGPWRQEASQPPLYYILGAVLTTWIDTEETAFPYNMENIRHLNPHVAAGEINADGSNVNLVVHNPALERFPWKGTVLAVHIARLFSVLLGTWAVYLTWALVQELFPAFPRLALLAAATHAFTPMYLFISASINNDNLIVPLCSLALLIMVRRVKKVATKIQNPKSKIQSPKSGVRDYLYLGIVIGLGLLTKASAIGLLPLAAATIAWEAWQGIKLRITIYELRFTNEISYPDQSNPPIKKLINNIKIFARYSLFAIRNSLLVLLPALTIAGWWFYRNVRLYCDWLGLNAFYAVLGTRDVPADFAQLWAERFAFAAGYWGNFGGLNVPMLEWIYTILNTIAVVAFVSVVARFIIWAVTPVSEVKGQQATNPDSSIQNPKSKIQNRRFSNLWPFSWDELTAARALAWAWPAAVFVSWIRWATITWSSQGRLIFSAISMWSLALVLPTTNSELRITNRGISSNIRYSLFVIRHSIPIFLLILCLVALPAWIVPSYTPPAATRNEISNPYTAHFGNILQLQGYTIEKRAIHPGESIGLTLYWEARQPTATDHSLFIHLLGENDRIIAQRDTFPGRGLVSTTWMEAGQTWKETYIIPTPPMAYAPDNLSFAVGLYETASGVRVPVTGAGDTPLSETARFGDVWLAENPDTVPNPIQMRFGKGMVLTGYDISSTSAARGQQLKVTLHWACEAPIEDNYTVSVQVIDSQWRKAAQSDMWPLDGAAPTSSWQVGQTLEENRVLTIAPDAAPSVYDLRLAVYRMGDDGQLQHLPIVWETGQMPVKDITLTRIRVE